MKVKLTFDFTEHFLEEKKLTIDDIKKEVMYLADIFGKKYTEIFPTEISNNNIDAIFYYSSILKPIEKLDGFKRHIAKYNFTEKEDHLFTAKVAKYLHERGFEIVLEPVLEPDKPGPDIKLKKGEMIAYVECKRGDISNLFGYDLKKEIADIVYEKVKTCDQIDLSFNKGINLNKVREIFENQDVIKKIHMAYDRGNDGKESKIKIDSNLDIGIIQKPAIFGSEGKSFITTLEVIMEDTHTEKRNVGYVFMKGGRSISITELIDYSGKLIKRRRKSSRQLVDGYPNFVFLDGTVVVGDPDLHKKYINDRWLTKDLGKCNGVVIFEQYFDLNLAKLKIYENKNAIINFDFKSIG